MKRLVCLMGGLLILSSSIFAQNQAIDDQGTDDIDVPVQEYEYDQNGKGDQFIKIGIMPNFPLNFKMDGNDQLYIGGAVQLGYYRFLNSWFAAGGELMAGYNLSRGSNILTFVPITGGVMFQPTIWKFEFPINLSLGIAFSTCQNKKRFPDPVFKAEAGAFFRIAESWSFGLSGQFLVLPNWWYDQGTVADPFTGLFTQATISARYHF